MLVILLCDFVYPFSCIIYIQIWDGVSTSAKDFISKLLTVDPMERIDTGVCSIQPWIKSQPPLHKRSSESKTTQRRLNSRHRRQSNAISYGGTGGSAFRLRSKSGARLDDESSMMSESSWTNYMINKATPSYKRQKTSESSNIVLPVAGDFQGKVITKDKILFDQESTMSPSNIDSALATDDSNSQVSSQFGTMQLYYYKNMVAAQTPEEKEQAKQEYMDYMKAHELKLPTHLPIVSGGGTEVGPNATTGVIIPKVGSLKERKLSVHDQFENIDEESEDGLNGSKMMGLTKLDRIYGSQGNNANSVVSSGSQKSNHMSVETNNASYIEKVGIWLSDSRDGNSNLSGKFSFNQDKYKILTSDSLLSSRRTISQKSNLTTSDHSQASSFNRVFLPASIHHHKKKSSLQGSNGDVHSQSFISNATSTTDLLPPSIASSMDRRNGRYNMKDTIIDIQPGTGSFNSAASYRPLID